ncbi:MAG: hypothetical protein JXR05_11375 [Flavobacteriaceae bacterium]
MKKTLFILCLIMASTSLTAQILPVENLKLVKPEDRRTFYTQIEGITHIKDVNGILDKFVGTWKGTFDGKQLEIVVKKYTRDYSEFVKDFHPEPLLWDQLVLKHKLTNQNGTVIYSTLDKADDSADVMYKEAYRKPTVYSFNYQGENHNCGDNGTVFIFIKSNTQNTQAYFKYLHSGSTSPDCNTYFGAVFPTDGEVLLTKQ